MTRSKFWTMAIVLGLIVAALSINAVAAQDEGALQITLVINGFVDDQSFFESAQRGMDNLLDDGFDVAVNTVELGLDRTTWEPGLDDVMSDTDSYDVLIAGTFDMLDFMAARVHLYPDKRFVFFDASLPYDDPEACIDACENVYSIEYAQNEGSLLAGVYAGAITTSGIDGANDEVVIGSIGGQDIPVIQDFVVAYEQGACLVNPAITNIAQTVGGDNGWNDPARAKEITLAMYEQGADIVFNIAGGSGNGIFDAAAEQGHYAIGVDSDQALIVANSFPEQAERILTSMMKNVDNSLYRAIDLHLKDELPYGSTEVLGISEGGVGLADNEFFRDSTPENIVELIEAVEEAVIAGDISVNSAFGDNPTPVGLSCAEQPETNFDVAAFLGD